MEVEDFTKFHKRLRNTRFAAVRCDSPDDSIQNISEIIKLKFRE
jgi:hypothetical protein